MSNWEIDEVSFDIRSSRGERSNHWNSLMSGLKPDLTDASPALAGLITSCVRAIDRYHALAAIAREHLARDDKPEDAYIDSDEIIGAPSLHFSTSREIYKSRFLLDGALKSASRATPSFKVEHERILRLFDARQAAVNEWEAKVGLAAIRLEMASLVLTQDRLEDEVLAFNCLKMADFRAKARLFCYQYGNAMSGEMAFRLLLSFETDMRR